MKNVILFFGSLALMLGIEMPAMAANPDITTGLVLHYDFEDDPTITHVVIDRTGNGNNGVVYGDVTRIHQSQVGKGAYKFDGNGDYIQVPASSLLDTPRFTVSLWIQSDELTITVGGARAPLGRHAAGDNTNAFWMFQEFFSPELPSFFNAQVFGDNPYRRSSVFMEDVSQLLHKWTLVTLTYDGTLMKFYVDGRFTGLEPVPGYLGSSLQYLIGAGEYADGNATQFWMGTIDDVRVYNRALSADDVLELQTHCGKSGCQ